MFIVSQSLDTRAAEIRSLVPKHPSVALVVAASYFEWTLCRAIIGLSRRPNVEIRHDLERVHGLAAYKDSWRRETEHLPDAKPLPEIVRDWTGVIAAFTARNVLVHGRDRHTQNMVRPNINAIVAAVANVCGYCLLHGLNINDRLPQRRQKKSAATTKEPPLRTADWEHRLHVLWAWREWRLFNGADRDRGAAYRAVLDGCAVTIRALCDILGVRCQFKNASPIDEDDRLDELLACCHHGRDQVRALACEDQRCLLDVLFLGNRAVAHPKDGKLDHKVGKREMTAAINTVLEWLRTKARDWPALDAVNKDFLSRIE